MCAAATDSQPAASPAGTDERLKARNTSWATSSASSREPSTRAATATTRGYSRAEDELEVGAHGAVGGSRIPARRPCPPIRPTTPAGSAPANAGTARRRVPGMPNEVHAREAPPGPGM